MVEEHKTGPLGAIVVVIAIISMSALIFGMLSTIGILESPPQNVLINVGETITVPYSVSFFSPLDGHYVISTINKGEYNVVITTDSPSDSVDLVYKIHGNYIDYNKFGSYNAAYDRWYPRMFGNREDCVSDQWKNCEIGIQVPNILTESKFIIGVRGSGSGNITIIRKLG